MVGATGFEPATSSSQNWHSTKLSYAPTCAVCLSQSHRHRNLEMPAVLRPDQAAGTLRPRLAAMKPLDQCLLYGFVDSAYLDGRDPAELCRQLCDGGTDLVQLRAKDWPVDDIARLAKRLGEVDRAQVGPGRRDRVGMRLHPRCLAAKQPAQGVVGVRADVGDAAGRRQPGVIAPRERHVVRARIVPAIDHAANVTQQAGLKHLAGSHQRLAVTRPKRHVMRQPGIA